MTTNYILKKITILVFLLSITFQTIGQKNKFYNYGLFEGDSETDKYFSNERVKSRIIKNIVPLKKGDVIASIGAGLGWEEAIYASQTDSVHYYLQDLKSVKTISNSFNRNLNKFETNSTQKNKYSFVEGAITHTNLPSHTFDVILISNAFHEFTAADLLLKDIKLKLKPYGKLIIIEHFSTPWKKFKYAGCKKTGYTFEAINKLMNKHGFFLSSLSAPKGSNYNAMTFSQDNLSNFIIKKDLEVLDSLGLRQITFDKIKFSKIENRIIENQNYIDSVYKDFPTFLYESAKGFTQREDFVSAQRILELGTKLYPKNLLYTKLLGQVYYFNGKFNLANAEFAKYPESKGFRIVRSNYKYFIDKSDRYQKRGKHFSSSQLVKREKRHFFVKLSIIRIVYATAIIYTTYISLKSSFN